MSAVFLLWLGSLLTMSGIIALAAMRRPEYAAAEATLADLVRDEMHRAALLARTLAYAAFKKGSALLVSGAVPLRRGNELFMERMFGKVKIERGRASSFFLKRIAEHKDVIKRGGEFL